MTVEPSLLAFCVAAAGHAGFQVTVTALVYPALVRVPGTGWQEAHARHSRTIAPVVALLYGALVATGAWTLVSAASAPAVVAVGLTAGCLAVTALLAAPTHGRLTEPEPRLLARLLVVDRARAALAVAALVASLVALTA